MKKKLFVFDFDGTIVSGHTHNEIIKEKKANPDAPEYINGDWAVVQGFPIIASTDTWKNIFENINQQGHYAAINSFNSFGPIIPEFLEKIGLDEDFIKKEIHIIAKFPANPAKENKNAYIQESIAKAIEKSGEKKDFSGNAEDVILIDDSKKNIEAAKQAGYQVIHAKKDGSHLIELQTKLEELKKEELRKLEEQPPAVDRNAKPKQLSESLLKLKIKTLEKQREALTKQREEHLEEINIYSNNETILLNDQKLNELNLADKENDEQLSKVKSQLSKLQGQVHNDKSAIVSKKVIEQSPQLTVDLSHAKQLKQKIEKYKNMQEEHLETILQLSHKKNLSSEENSTLSSLKSDLPGITLAIQVNEEYLGKIEKRDALVIDHDSKSKPFETNSESQGAVPKKKSNAVKPEINLGARLKERSEQTKDSQKPLSEVSKPTQPQKKLEDLLKAKPKKDNPLENSSKEQDVSAFKDKQKLIADLLAKPRTKPIFFQPVSSTSSNLSSDENKKMKKEETKTASKQFSR